MVPLLFTLLMVIIELGILLSIQVGLANSAREVARSGAMYQYAPATPPDETPSVAFLDAERAAAMERTLTETLNPLIDSLRLNPATQRYSYVPAVPANNYRYGDRLAVTLEYQHQLFFGVLGRNMALRANSEMRLEPGGR